MSIFDLVRRLAHEYADDEGVRLRRPVTPDTVARVRDGLGFAIPPILSRVYTEIADGGFGPDHGLLPLTGDGETVVGAYQTLRNGQDVDRDGRSAWPPGVLPVLNWGCGMYAAVDCVGDDNPVLLFEPNVYDDDWTATWFLDQPSLTAWFESWDDSNAWFSEYRDPDESTFPVPWRDAAARLTAV